MQIKLTPNHDMHNRKRLQCGFRYFSVENCWRLLRELCRALAPLEIIWSVLPLILCVGIFFWGLNGYMKFVVAPGDAIRSTNRIIQ